MKLLTSSFLITIALFMCLNVNAQDEILQFLYTDFETNWPNYGYGGLLTDSINPWIIDTTNSENIWQIGRPQKLIFDSAYSVPNAMITDTVNPYPINNHSSFQFNIKKPSWGLNRGWSVVRLFFDYKLNTDSLHDGGYIDVSYDGGQTWTNAIFDNQGDCDVSLADAYTTDDTIIGGIPAFTGNTKDWVSAQIIWFWPVTNWQLIDSAIIRFNFVSDSIQTNKQGWLIDNIYFMLEDYTGIGINENNFSKQEVKIYPNPVENVSVIEWNNTKNESYSIEFYNMLGEKQKVVKNIKSNNFEIHKNDFSPGVYLFQLINKKNEIKQGRFVVK